MTGNAAVPGKVALALHSDRVRLQIPTNSLRSVSPTPKADKLRTGACVPFSTSVGGTLIARLLHMPQGHPSGSNGARLVNVPHSAPTSRGEWMPGASPRPAPHSAPLDILIADAD